MRILLLTGPGGDAQGWGDMKVTESVRQAADSLGHPTRIAFVDDEDGFFRLLEKPDFDIVWSALYHITPNEAFIGRNAEGTWVADVLDERRIPYIGSDSRAMRAMIDKFRTHEILDAAGVAVPAHLLLRSGDDASSVIYPAFVKPICESRSVGISDESVVHDETELRRRVAFVEREFDEPALVEEFLPGDEYTALVLGSGKTRECLPGRVTVEDKHYRNYRILRSDLRGVGLTKVGLAGERTEEARRLADDAAEAMNCLDHVRIDMRVDRSGKLRIIEVNGIPGLKPHKSWAPQIYTLYHPSPLGEDEDYRRLIGVIVDSAGRRYGLYGASLGDGPGEPVRDGPGETWRRWLGRPGHELGQRVPPELDVLEGRDAIAEHGRAFFRLGLHLLEDRQDFFLEACGAVIGEIGAPGLGHPSRRSERLGDAAQRSAESRLLTSAKTAQTSLRDPVGLDLISRQTSSPDPEMEDEAGPPVIEVSRLPENEVPQAVGDKPAPADLQPLGNMGMVADDAIGAGVGEGAEGLDDVGGRERDVLEPGVADDDDEVAPFLGLPDAGA
jgi:D-alanine-D-alanine ligase